MNAKKSLHHKHTALARQPCGSEGTFTALKLATQAVVVRGRKSGPLPSNLFAMPGAAEGNTGGFADRKPVVDRGLEVILFLIFGPTQPLISVEKQHEAACESN